MRVISTNHNGRIIPSLTQLVKHTHLASTKRVVYQHETAILMDKYLQ